VLPERCKTGAEGQRTNLSTEDKAKTRAAFGA
jgi:hypothetical protein